MNWTKLPVATALAFRSDGRRSRLYFQTQPGSDNSEQLISFLRALRGRTRGQLVILIWDSLPAHRSGAMTTCLSGQQAWLSVERLPSYAPDLSPVEHFCGNIKGHELANLCAADLSELGPSLHAGMARVRQEPQVPFAFPGRAGHSLLGRVSLWNVRVSSSPFL